MINPSAITGAFFDGFEVVNSGKLPSQGVDRRALSLEVDTGGKKLLDYNALIGLFCSAGVTKQSI